MKNLYLKPQNQEQTETIVCPHCGYEHLYSWETAAFYQYTLNGCFACKAELSVPAPEIPALHDLHTEINAHLSDTEASFILPPILQMRQK